MLTRQDLRPYQTSAVEFVKRTDNCALWLDPGLGKTAITLTAYADLVLSFDSRRALVFAPKRVASKVWRDEIAEWQHLDGIQISCMTGSTADKFAALKVPADIHTVNREATAWLEAQFVQGKRVIKPWPWDLVIVDESQSYMSQSAERWKSLARLRRLFPRMVMLTGTPAPRGYGALWAQYALLDGPRGPWRLGATEKAFLERWFDEPTRDCGFAKPRLKAHAKAEIQAAIAPITLSMRAKDYLDLPPVIYNPIRVTLPPAILSKYKRFHREYVLELASQKTITAVNAGVLHGKLLQLAGGAVYVDDKGNFELLHNEKIDALMEFLESFEDKKVLIGYAYQSDLKRLAEPLNRFCGQKRKWAQLRSDAQFAQWARGDFDIGVLHPGSAGHGLNDVYKAGVEDLIWFNLTANLELYQQLNGRIASGHRVIGRNVRIHHILAEDTEDMRTFNLLAYKATDQDDLTDAMAKLTRT